MVAVFRTARGAVVQAEVQQVPADEVGQVPLRRGAADAELLGHLDRGQGVRRDPDLFEHLGHRGGQPPPARLVDGRAAQEAVEGVDGLLVRDVEPGQAFAQPTVRGELLAQLSEPVRLDRVVDGPQLHGLPDAVDVLRGGDDEVGAGCGPAEGSHRLEPVAVGRVEVEQQQVRPEGENPRQAAVIPV